MAPLPPPGIAAQITQRRQTQLFGPRLGHQDHRRRAIRQRRAAEVMTAYASPFREPLEQDNNIRKNSTLADYQKLARHRWR
jgi:acetyl-CoA acyltransferase